MGLEVLQVGDVRDLDDAEAVFVGGGNTFRLLRTLHRRSLVEPIRELVRAGMPYLGSSAGTNVAAPTIKTTNDMPIVEVPSLDGFGFVPFQINPHYLDPSPASTHMGETREERISDYLEENDIPVIGLREGSALRAEQGSVRLVGERTARLFRRGQPPAELAPGAIRL
ncbi:MAG: peptidase dipeptidase [Acidobacteria bacterium]|nr:peptidase dipeptidase [Acidobacteriota bacterium]